MENANENCVGPTSENAGKASSCAGCPNQSACSSGATKEALQDAENVASHIGDRMALVKHKLLVLSGKGGVGKSTCAAQLAFAMAQQGYQVGLLDIDICGPSIPHMLGLIGHEVHQSASGWSPVYVDDNLGVMSIGFMLPSTDDAIIWRGPRKNGLIKQFLTDVVWNELDYLIIDTPPGTSDEHISIVQYLKASNIVDAVVVTTPQEVSMADVRKELNFCKKTGLNVIGVIENMADFRIPMNAIDQSKNKIRLLSSSSSDITEEMLNKIKQFCPELLDCTISAPLFTTPDDNNVKHGPEQMAQKFNVPYLGKLPMDPNMMLACEKGESFLETFPTSAASEPFKEITKKIVTYYSSS